MTDASVRAVLARHREPLMAVEGVVGTGVGECGGEPCIRVLVERRTPAVERGIPDRLEGVKVEVVTTGPLRVVEEGEKGRG